MNGPVLFWVQHLLGSGHLRRIASIARALAAREVEAVVASGGLPIAHLDIGDAHLVQLPPVRTADVTFSRLVDGDGCPVDETLLASRRAILTDLVAETHPSVVVTETFPFGRRVLHHEAMTLLDAAATLSPAPRIVASVRDILQRTSCPEKAMTMRDIALARYDHVLVHGDPGLVRFGDSFPCADDLGERVIHTGYIADTPRTIAQAGDGADEVIVSAGGGAVGERLLETAIAAQRHATVTGHLVWRILTGDRSTAAAVRGAGGGMVVEPNRADFPDLLARCRVSVSQGGYNTATDLFRARARAVVVPFAEGGETEQSDRAARLAGRGMIVMLSEAALSPATLAKAIDRAAALPRLDPDTIDLDGAERSADLLCSWSRNG
ncbi:MAG: glycosyltransferase [Rhodospirillales bacterium]|nr:glycosyltransferase [Rhodospirillales bacterium]